MQARRQITVDKDPYRVLGVDRKADGAAIRQAYTDKAKTCHPDVSETPDASAFLEISDAYNLLMDDQMRASYDRAWMQKRAGIDDARLTETMTPAQAAIVTLAGLAAGAPVIIPLTLAHYCVQPFASAIKSMSASCPM